MIRFFSIVCVLFITSCVDNKNETAETKNNVEKTFAKNNSQAAIQVMQRHLDAVTNRDLNVLEQTLTPEGTMQLLLPATELKQGNKAFMDYHKEWFAIPDWTFKTRIVNSDIGTDMGSIIVEIIYGEPLRDGKPYFNRMQISYVLKKIDGKWYVTKDHASSIEKSTD